MQTLTVRFIGIVTAGFLVAGTATARAALTTTSLAQGVTGEELAGDLLGSGVAISNVTVRGCGVGLGRFAGGGGIVGLESGIVLSTGDVASVVGPNTAPNVGTDCDVPGAGDLDELVAVGGTGDAAVLELDLVPAGDTIAFRYVFASEEYPEFVGSAYNDVFGFFVNGVNLARLPGTPRPVTVNAVNATTNAVAFVDNAAYPGPLDTQADGLTQVLTFTAPVVAGQLNHLKLAIADTGDRLLDSWIFIGAGSLASTNASADIEVKGTTAIVECDMGAPGASVGWCAGGAFAQGSAASGDDVAPAAVGDDVVPAPPGLQSVTSRVRRNVRTNGKARLRLALNARGKRLLRRRGTLETLVVARVTDDDGRAIDFQRLVTFKRR